MKRAVEMLCALGAALHKFFLHVYPFFGSLSFLGVHDASKYFFLACQRDLTF